MLTQLKQLHTFLTQPFALFYLKGIAVLFVAIFTFVQWVLPLYWERQVNLDFKFQNFKDSSAIKAQPMVGFSEQCLLWGTLEIINKSEAPLHIKNTHLVFIPYDIETCDINDKKCVKTINHPTVLGNHNIPLIDYEMSKLMKDFHSTTVYPVTQTHDVFPDGDATRPFTVAIPMQHIKKERLTVVAAQEYGSWYCESITEDKWYLPQCHTSRAIVHIPSPC